MSVLGIGVDLVENARIEHSLERFGERFLHRVFTAGEIEYSQSMKYPARHLAARFADLGFHRLDLGIEIEIVLVRMVLQVLEAALQFQDRLFKVQRVRFHGRDSHC